MGHTISVQVCEWRLDIEWMDPRQSNKSRISRNMLVRSAFVNIQDLSVIFRGRGQGKIWEVG